MESFTPHIINITTALEFMREEEVALIPKTMFLIGSFLLYYVFLCLLLKYAKQEYRPEKAFIGKLLLILGVFTGLMALFYQQMYVNIAVSAIMVWVTFLLFRQLKKQGRRA